MREHKAAATTAGVLYITGTGAGVLSKVVGAPVRDAGDPLAAAAEHSGAVVIAIGWLLIAPLGEVMSAGPGTASPAGVRLGRLMIDSDATGAVVQTIVFCLGAVIFYVLLYRSRIAPRWIASWGLVAIPFYAAADVLAAYAVIAVNSTAQNVLFAPIFVQEMVLAAWMIARGFRPAAPWTGREEPRRPSSRDDTLATDAQHKRHSARPVASGA